jgi:hypothetical protein
MLVGSMFIFYATGIDTPLFKYIVKPLFTYLEHQIFCIGVGNVGFVCSTSISRLTATHPVSIIRTE